MAGNITWGKTISNWGRNADLDTLEPEENKKEVIVLSYKEKLLAKEEIVSACNELVEKSSSLYEIFTNKELYDALVTLKSAQKALNLIYIKEDKVETVK